MALVNQGILGQFTNKVGNVVGRVRLGQNVMSVYQPNVSNPNTQDQQNQRSKFAVISRFMSPMNSAIAQGFRYLKGDGKTAQNVFMKTNFATAFMGTFPNYSIQFSNILVAKGDLMMVANPSAGSQASGLAIGWTDNSGIGNASANDMLNVAIFNSAKNSAIFFPDVARRAALTYLVTTPSTWAGDSVEVYIFFNSAVLKKNSDSVYCGSISL